MKITEIIPNKAVKVRSPSHFFDFDARPFLDKVLRVNKICRSGLIEVTSAIDINQRYSFPLSALEAVEPSTWYKIRIEDGTISPLKVLYRMGNHGLMLEDFTPEYIDFNYGNFDDYYSKDEITASYAKCPPPKCYPTWEEAFKNLKEFTMKELTMFETFHILVTDTISRKKAIVDKVNSLTPNGDEQHV